MLLNSSRRQLTCGLCGEHYDPQSHHSAHCRPIANLFVDKHSSSVTDADFAARVASDGLREDVACGLADMRYGRGFDEPDIRLVKERVSQWTAERDASLVALVRPLLSPEVADEDVHALFREVDLFDGLRTAKQEMAHASKDVPCLKPRVVQATAKHKIVSFSMRDLLVRKLQHDTAFRKRCRFKSEQWKRGDKYRVVPSGTMRDMDDAVAMRFHPWAMKPAGPDEVDDFRIMWGLEADDLEVQHPHPCPHLRS